VRAFYYCLVSSSFGSSVSVDFRFAAREEDQDVNSQPRDLEVVRLTAELLSSGAPLAEMFERFATMLGRFIDAPVAFVAISKNGNAFLEHALDHGVYWRDAHVRINPSSQTERALVFNETIVMRSQEDLAGPVISLRFPGARGEDSASGIYVPLRFGDSAIGVLSVQSDRLDAYTEDDIRLVETCAPYVAIAVHAELMRTEMQELEHATARDAVTGVATRRIFDQRLHDDWSRARRDGTSIALVLLDVDWFKLFNDTYGHVAGDVCLKQIAQAASSCLTRDTDLFARYGGEEFIAILWSTDAEGALVAAQRIRDAVYALDIPHSASPMGRVTVSIGVAAARASSTSAETLLRAADHAMYAAKTSGRDRIVVDRFDEGVTVMRSSAVHNLRTLSTTFLDRAEEIAELTQLLGPTRAISIVGPPGVGKTRTALTIAQRRMYAYLDGTWFIDVSTITDPEFLDVAVAAVLGVAQLAGRGVRQSLLENIEQSKMLLIFDGCDRLRSEVGELVRDIVQRAPLTTIVTTECVPRDASDEHVFELRPFDDAQATAMFIERARSADHAFALHERDRDLIRELCHRVGMLPLTIEIAAAQVKTMKLPEIVNSLDPEPIDPLGETIAWSYGLLDPVQQRLLENSAIFPATFDSEALRGVCSDDVVEPWDANFVLNALVEKNLIVPLREGRRERYQMPAAIREYMRVRLRERSDSAQVERRFVRYFRAVARRIGSYIAEEAVEAALELGECEFENIRAAIACAVDGRDPHAGCEIVLALSRFWNASAHLPEGIYWIERALKTVKPDRPVRASLLHAAALIAESQGDVARLTSLGEALIAMHDERDTPQNLARALTILAVAKERSGDAESAEDLYRQALEQYRVADDRRGIATTLMHLGAFLAQWKDDYEEARGLLMGSLEIFRMLGMSLRAGTALAYLGEVSALQRDYERALAYSAESLAMFERLGDTVLAAWQILDMARYRIELGERGGVKRGLRLARKYLSARPVADYVVTYLDTAFAFAVEAGAYELAARIAGHAQTYLNTHLVTRSPKHREAFAVRQRRLQTHLNEPDYARLIEAGARADLGALQDEVEALGD